MRYWPISLIAQSPLMAPAHGAQVLDLYNRLPSVPAFEACFDVARHTQHVGDRLNIIESTDARNHFMYTEMPSYDEWARLERAGVLETVEKHMFVMLNYLH